METSDEWITSRTGIKERHMAAKDEFTSDLASRPPGWRCSAPESPRTKSNSLRLRSTAAPAPSPKSTQVLRSCQSTMEESFSAPMTSTVS